MDAEIAKVPASQKTCTSKMELSVLLIMEAPTHKYCCLLPGRTGLLAVLGLW